MNMKEKIVNTTIEMRYTARIVEIKEVYVINGTMDVRKAREC